MTDDQRLNKQLKHNLRLQQSEVFAVSQLVADVSVNTVIHHWHVFVRLCD